MALILNSSYSVDSLFTLPPQGAMRSSVLFFLVYQTDLSPVTVLLVLAVAVDAAQL